MSANPSDSHILAWARLMKASQLVLGAVEAELKAAGFPPLAWYDVLLELNREERGRLRPVEIEGRLLIAQHNVSRLIDRLEKAGYVARQRCQDDGRGQVISITDEGRALLKTMWPCYRQAIQTHVAAKLTEMDARDLADLLSNLIDG
ncbi:MarR family winged helix-turn-helix transcriptional regulator [Phreatobacter oligotrophus]|jgi:DNA-binding MarR family transcriptional regulator|uniref:MarR family transcriptional regulator n=1 Tax=Phreatobacter oligotrophus TaxID=1122261 RepID=A0A2T4Z2C7_9HYPH|nr:MarR family transcriptional regulator [Phreatobacter oligotrophus]PTM54901.1 MarR family transcriptional regulator [Phreatobacter oligotrophus]